MYIKPKILENKNSLESKFITLKVECFPILYTQFHFFFLLVKTFPTETFKQCIFLFSDNSTETLTSMFYLNSNIFSRLMLS